MFPKVPAQTFSSHPHPRLQLVSLAVSSGTLQTSHTQDCKLQVFTRYSWATKPENLYDFSGATSQTLSTASK